MRNENNGNGTQAGTKKTVKRRALRDAAPKKSRKLNINNEPAALRREIKKLQATVEDVWELLNTVNAESSSGEMFNVIDAACVVMMTRHPKEFHYEEGEPQDSEMEAKQLEVTAKALQRSVAEGLGVSEKQFAKMDLNQTLPEWQKIVERATGMAVEPDKLTYDDYLALVAFDLIKTMILTAKPPTTFRAETAKYLKAVKEVKAKIPQNRRKPSDEVERAASMYMKGKRWPTIYYTIYPDLNSLPKDERREKKETLRRRAKALIYARESRSGKKSSAKKNRG